jgi:hypothetical protein
LAAISLRHLRRLRLSRNESVAGSLVGICAALETRGALR